MTQLDVDTFTEIRDKFNTEPQCEHSTHGYDTVAHFGPAKWHLTTQCPSCDDVNRLLVCQRWYEFAAYTIRRVGIRCRCGYMQHIREYFTQSTWVRL